MKFDKRFYPHTSVSLVMALIFPFSQIGRLPLYDGLTVHAIESLQSLWLLLSALFTCLYVRNFLVNKQKCAFWMWSVVWWITLFGRGISWGRDYFPDGPKLIFRIISIALIGSIILLFFIPYVRREVVSKLNSGTFPLWDCVLMVLCFLIADTVEHHRYFSFLFLYDLAYQDLMEELYETPFMISLFYVAYYLMKKDRDEVAKSTSG